MMLIQGLFVFLLRLTLLIQSPVAELFPHEIIKEDQFVSSAANDSQIHSKINADHQNICGLCEGEKEEKSESETESLADCLAALNEAGFLVSHKEYYNPFFGNKALQGNQHLYDLFHSWKIHLS